jgi:hypothetical protein
MTRDISSSDNDCSDNSNSNGNGDGDSGNSDSSDDYKISNSGGRHSDSSRKKTIN